MEPLLNNINIEAEQSLLGSIMFNNDLLTSLSVEREDFALPCHQAIFSHIQSCLSANLSANPMSLKQLFQTLPEGGEYLKTILNNINSLLFPSEIHQILTEMRLKREIQEILLKGGQMLSETPKNSQEIKDSLLESLEELSIKNQSKKPSQVGKLARNAFSKTENNMIYFGYKGIDKITNGFDLGSLVILAGRPAMGKSCLAMNIALKACKTTPVLMISLEMSGEQISKRIISNLASINLSKLRHNNLSSQAEVEAFQRALLEADKLPIEIKDGGDITLSKLRYEIKKFVNKTKGKLVIVDYIQIIKHQVRGGMVEKITEITNALKAMAMEFGIVILGLSQLSRAVENREDKRPLLSDLRDSGSIEQDADVVIFTFRPEYYLQMEKPQNHAALKEWEDEMNRLKGIAYAIIAKVRDGECGDAKLFFEGNFQRFTDNNF